jgi:integrase
VHEIDRRIEADSPADAAKHRANVRDEWLRERGRRVVEAGPARLGEAIEQWFHEKRLTIKPSTASTYSSAVTWWTAVLGDYLLSELEPLDVREALAGGREGGDASDTLDGRLRVLRTFAREERLARIVEGVRVRRDVREEERLEDEGRGLSLEELRRFLDAGPHLETTKRGEITKPWRRSWALVATMAWTGLRFGEVTALEWRDVDLDGGTVRVRRAQWRGIVGHVKAKASKRTVALPHELVETLSAHRRAMVAHQQTGVELPLVFPSRRRGATYVSNIYARKAILRVCDAAGIELDGRPAVHMLRHTFNNVLRQNASELVRQALVGHADEAIGERYSAVTMEERRAAVARVVGMVRGEGHPRP